MSLAKYKARVIITVFFMALISFLSVINIKLLKDPVKKLMYGKTGFKQMTKEIANNYNSNQLKYKKYFINMNGLFARVSGRRKYNDVLLLKDNILSFNLPFDDGKTNRGTSWKSELALKKTIELARFSNNLNIPFVYIVAPYKISISRDNLPKGLKDPINRITDDFLKGLSAASVPSLDLRPHFSATSEHIKNYFYHTDHHWSPDAAFLAFQVIMSEIERINLKKGRIKSNYSNSDLWKRYEKNRWILGSHGKRVGIYFAGVDSLIYYVPNFPTRMSFMTPHNGQMFKGDFTVANMREKFIQNSNYFEYYPGSIYIGDNYPLVHHYNYKTTNKVKILILRDSFSLPLESFMSTEISELDTLDSRFYNASTIAEYILWTKPDMVLLIRYAGSTEDVVFKFDNYIDNTINSYNNTKLLVKEYNASLTASESNHRYERIPVSLCAGKTYSVSFKNIKITQGESDGVSVALYDLKKKEIIRQEIIDIEFCNNSDEDSRWTFKVPEEEAEYALLIYAGVSGKTKNVGVEYRGINVSLLN